MAFRDCNGMSVNSRIIEFMDFLMQDSIISQDHKSLIFYGPLISGMTTND